MTQGDALSYLGSGLWPLKRIDAIMERQEHDAL